MSWDCCREAVHERGDVMCTVNVCAAVQAAIQALCQKRDWPPCTPVAMYNDGRLCFCCCLDPTEELEPPADPSAADGYRLDEQG